MRIMIIMKMRRVRMRWCWEVGGGWWVWWLLTCRHLPENKPSKTHLPGWCLLTSQCTTLISTCSVSSNSLLNSQVSKKWQCYHSYKNWCHFYFSKKKKCHHSYNNFVTFVFFQVWVSYFICSLSHANPWV